MNDDLDCPKCGEGCYRDSVDVGVGVIHGPFGCPSCGWSEDPRYDSSGGESQASKDNPDWIVDAQGGMIRRSVVADKLKYFGLDPNIADEL